MCCPTLFGLLWWFCLGCGSAYWLIISLMPWKPTPGIHDLDLYPYGLLWYQSPSTEWEFSPSQFFWWCCWVVRNMAITSQCHTPAKNTRKTKIGPGNTWSLHFQPNFCRKCTHHVLFSPIWSSLVVLSGVWQCLLIHNFPYAMETNPRHTWPRFASLCFTFVPQPQNPPTFSIIQFFNLQPLPLALSPFPSFPLPLYLSSTCHCCQYLASICEVSVSTVSLCELFVGADQYL